MLEETKHQEKGDVKKMKTLRIISFSFWPLKSKIIESNNSSLPSSISAMFIGLQLQDDMKWTAGIAMCHGHRVYCKAP
uniref:Uncharacterized protein n=1 Tax=Romanomermis culicivorax TaxID=13658 RepID=A0A915IJT6_ROMCU